MTELPELLLLEEIEDIYSLYGRQKGGAASAAGSLEEEEDDDRSVGSLSPIEDGRVSSSGAEEEERVVSAAPPPASNKSLQLFAGANVPSRDAWDPMLWCDQDSEPGGGGGGTPAALPLLTAAAVRPAVVDEPFNTFSPGRQALMEAAKANAALSTVFDSPASSSSSNKCQLTDYLNLEETLSLGIRLNAAAAGGGQGGRLLSREMKHHVKRSRLRCETSASLRKRLFEKKLGGGGGGGGRRRLRRDTV